MSSNIFTDLLPFGHPHHSWFQLLFLFIFFPRIIFCRLASKLEWIHVLPVPTIFHLHPLSLFLSSSSPLSRLAAALQTRRVHQQRQRRHPCGRDVGSLESLWHLFADVRRRHQDRHAGMQPARVSKPSVCSHARLSFHPSCQSQRSVDQSCMSRHQSRSYLACVRLTERLNTFGIFV